jgi:hypothetical protein
MLSEPWRSVLHNGCRLNDTPVARLAQPGIVRYANAVEGMLKTR